MTQWQDLPLANNHRDKLISSAISPQVAAERGYYSTDSATHLVSLGFSSNQARTPALVIPLYNPRGERVSYQIRPDDPRMSPDKRKPIKYETPAGSSLTIDTPRRITAHMPDNTRRLLITEGPLKADSAVSHGDDCVALTGVWNFRGKVPGTDRTAPLPEWDMINLRGRTAGIAFDEDMFTNPQIMRAADSLCFLLREYGADARILDLRRGAA